MGGDSASIDVDVLSDSGSASSDPEAVSSEDLFESQSILQPTSWADAVDDDSSSPPLASVDVPWSGADSMPSSGESCTVISESIRSSPGIIGNSSCGSMAADNNDNISCGNTNSVHNKVTENDNSSVNTNSVPKNVVQNNGVDNCSNVNTNSVPNKDNNCSVNTNSVCEDSSNSVNTNSVQSEFNVNSVNTNSVQSNIGSNMSGSVSSDALMVEVSGSRKRLVEDYSSEEASEAHAASSDCEAPEKKARLSAEDLWSTSLLGFFSS